MRRHEAQAQRGELALEGGQRAQHVITQELAPHHIRCARGGRDRGGGKVRRARGHEVQAQAGQLAFKKGDRGRSMSPPRNWQLTHHASPTRLPLSVSLKEAPEKSGCIRSAAPSTLPPHHLQSSSRLHHVGRSAPSHPRAPPPPQPSSLTISAAPGWQQSIRSAPPSAHPAPAVPHPPHHPHSPPRTASG